MTYTQCPSTELLVFDVCYTPVSCQFIQSYRLGCEHWGGVKWAFLRVLRTMNGTSRVVTHSSHTDVLAIGLYVWKMFHSHDLDKLRMRFGIQGSMRYILSHTLGDNIHELCKFVPAFQVLIACDIASKLDLISCDIKAGTTPYLSRFGKGRDLHDWQLNHILEKA